MSMIALTNGPWNGRCLHDSGAVVIRMGIATRWEKTIYGARPCVGAKTGCAVYEPDLERNRAFWSHNEWEGKTVGNYEA